MHDVNLTNQNVLQLSSADEVAAFFSQLGYNTNVRGPQTPQNLGITSNAALQPIKKIELLCQQDLNSRPYLQVYLIEVKSITSSHTRALANCFKNRGGEFLLILTKDYSRLDFVLVEKVLPPDKPTKSIQTPQVSIKPRILTIDRKKETEKAWLRTLRRFTYTEDDPVAQWGKLLSAYTIAEWSEEYFNNRALFSDYYLKKRLPGFEEWKEDSKPAFQELNSLVLQQIKNLRDKKESILRKDLLEPIFEILGFKFKVGKKAGSDADQPDYELYHPDSDDLLALSLAYPWGRDLDRKDYQRDQESPDEDPSRRVVSLLEKEDSPPWAIVTNGKVWRLYSKKTPSKASNYYEIDLEEVLVLSGPTDTFSEFFKYFWLFFRRQAFEAQTTVHEGEQRQASFLDRLLNESNQYAKELGERLKERVFENIFPYLARGFITHIREQDGKDIAFEEDRLDEVFQGTLTLLYRLLFLLYAEARDLLPVREIHGYHEVSLANMKTEIAELADAIDKEVEANLKKHYRKDQYDLYNRLARLFKVIDEGDPALNVPVYNGGLFLNKVPKEDTSAEARNTRFLNQYKVPDFHLAMALSRLTRDIDPKREDLVMVDFKSLGVRQLGSIYEGLLEFKVRVAPEKMAVIKGKKTEKIIPYTEAKRNNEKILTTGHGKNAPERTLPKGEVYLENDKHERKATGSYYTPDHIVEYIVENAVGPVLQEKFEQIRPTLREAQLAHRDAVKLKESFEKQKKQGSDPEKVANRAEFKKLVDDLFNIKVLDPAMGSGHFLVEAVDFITDKAIHFLNAFPWNPVTASLQETRETILEEMNRQGVAIDPNKLTDINLLRRQVLKRCVYGVDLNPMAVELAKVSLWLNCFTLGAPLSFLDHHMKCGNSLIGSTIEETQNAIKKEEALLFGGNQFAGLMLATDLMRHVGELSDVTSDQVKQSRDEFKRATNALRPYNRILDVYTSQWFSNPFKKVKVSSRIRGEKRTKIVSDALQFLQSEEAKGWIEKPNDTSKLTEFSKRIIRNAESDFSENSFFHWELEFPEVFFGPKGGSEQNIQRLENGGFDAVVGNPPYARVQTLQQTQPHVMDYLKAKYISAHGSFDIYVNFIEKGYHLLNPGGLFGKILPHKFFQAQFAEPIRGFLAEEKAIQQIVRFGAEQVFEEASTYTCLLFLSRKPGEQFKVIDVNKLSIPGDVFTALQYGKSSPDYQSETIPAPSDATWDFSVGGVRKVLDTLHRQSLTLGDITRKIFQGIATSADKIYVLRKLRESGDVLTCYSKALGREIEVEKGLVKPFLMGKDVHRYVPPNPENVVIFPYAIENGRAELMTQVYIQKTFPRGWEYLLENKKALSEREKGRFRDNWHCFSRPQNLTEFEAVKVMTPDVCYGPQMTIDESGNHYHTTTLYSFVFKNNVPDDPKYFMAILNSKLLWFFLQSTGTVLRGGYFRFKTEYLKPFPIACSLSESPPSSKQQDKMIGLVAEIISNRKQDCQCDISEQESAIDQLVYEIYGLNDQEIQIVEEASINY